MGLPREKWSWHTKAEWSTFALRAYAEMGRAMGFDHPAVQEGFQKLKRALDFPQPDWSRTGRLGNRHLHPRAHDALMLAARLNEEGGEGVDLEPAFGRHTLPWPPLQQVTTPWGVLKIRAEPCEGGGRVTFESERDLRLRVRWHGQWREGRPGGELRLEDQNPTGV